MNWHYEKRERIGEQHRFYFKNRTFALENFKFYKGNCRFCAEKDKCPREGIRFFDCYLNFKKLMHVYHLITGSFVVLLVGLMFEVYNFGFFKSAGIILLAITAFDIFCTFFEWIVSNIRDLIFYKKLIRLEKDEEEQKNVKKAEEEKEAKLLILKKEQSLPYYSGITKAEAFLSSLKNISSEVEFGDTSEDISKCIAHIEKIVDKLKEDSSKYERVKFLFEGYLPKFYNTLHYYSKLTISEEKREEYNEVLVNCVSKFLSFLDEQKIGEILEKSSLEIQFKANAEEFNNMINRGGFWK